MSALPALLPVLSRGAGTGNVSVSGIADLSVGDVALARAAGLGVGRTGPDAATLPHVQLQQPEKKNARGAVGNTWANSYAYTAAQLAAPTNVAGVQQLVRSALSAPLGSVARSLRALGSRHSFSSLADSVAGGTLVSVERFDPSLHIDGSERTCSFAAGWRYGDLARALHARGWALHNLASLPHISVGGAVATSTHGSGDHNGTLATAVRALEFVNGLGEVIRLRRGVDADFDGAVVALGCLGVLTRLTLAIEPAFLVRQDVYDHVTWTAVERHFDEMTKAAYSVSFFTRWGGEHMGLLWLKSRVAENADSGGAHSHPPDELFGARRETLDRHPLAGVSATSTTPQAGVAGPWSERLAHFRLEFTPSAGEELQSEYLLPRRNALKAIKFLRSMAGTLDPVLLVSEIRTMKADGLWLSSAYATQTDHASSSSDNRSCKKAEQAAGFVGLHFTWKALPREVCAVLPALESALLPLGGRPHWGKIFLAGHAQLRGLYPRWNDFRALALKHDPHGLFRNQWTGEKLDLPPLLSVLTSRRNAETSPSATAPLSARL